MPDRLTDPDEPDSDDDDVQAVLFALFVKYFGYAQGKQLAKDPERAIEILVADAENGENAAARVLNMLSDVGFQTETMRAHAANSWARMRADAENGDADAMVRLAFNLMANRSEDSDFEAMLAEANHWLKTAMAMGHPEAEKLLELFHRNNAGRDCDDQSAPQDGE